MIEITEEMREVIKSNIYLNITESTNRANITISGDFQGICQRIIELHEANKPKPEPFVYYKKQPWGYDECDYDDEGSFPLYDASPTRKPLDSQQIYRIMNQDTSGGSDLVWFARAIEQAHGIGTPQTTT